jgi:hypothetical protein
MMTEPTPVVQVSPAQPKSHMVRKVTAIILVLVVLVVFFFAPVVPYTFANSNTLRSSFSSYAGSGSISSITASVSPSYAILSCGEVWNPSAIISIVYEGNVLYQYSYKGWNGGQWLCN